MENAGITREEAGAMNNFPGTQISLTYRSIVDSIKLDLESVESLLRQEMRSEIETIDRMLCHPMFWGGKRIRPALLLLAGQTTATGHLSSEHHLLATVLEMIHAATLVHDDVLDDAMVRRHAESINRGWGSQLSVLLGDFLFSHAFYLASTTESTFACQQIGLATNAVCAGEIMQVGSQGNLELTEADYYRIVDGKTARLCAVACMLGAYCSGADTATMEGFEKVGLNYGRAFQIIDDVLDLKGKEATVGKSLGSDIRQGKMTLPLIAALRSTDTTRRGNLLAQFQQGQCELNELLHFVEQQGGFQYATNQAALFVRDAQATLLTLVGDSAQPLIQMGDFICERQL